MNKQALVDSIAYCGLVCGICHLRAECDFCKSTASLCARSEVCYQRNCCIKKGLQGCWECSEFPCKLGMFSDSESPKVKAFARCIREDGIEEFANLILRVLELGLDITQGGGLDNKSEKEVLALLRKRTNDTFV